MRGIKGILACLCLMVGCPCWAQSLMVEIAEIQVSGNDRTRESAVVRELTVHEGEQIPRSHLENKVKLSKESLLNTGLYNAVDIIVSEIDGSAGKIHLEVVVSENWYLYPAPSISLGDRSFGEWLRDHDASINRLNWGFRLYHLNATGRGDYLKLAFQTGVETDYSFKYRFPFFGNHRQYQVTTSFSYRKSSEVAYNTIGNKELFFSSNTGTPFKRLTATSKFTYRPALYSRHNFSLSFNNFSISDSVRNLNPAFFAATTNNISFLSLAYTFEGDYRDRQPIASEGYRLEVTLQKDGLGLVGDVNQASLLVAYEQYFKLSDKWTFYLAPKAKVNFTRQNRGYFFNDALGNQLIRGYESYVIDGSDFLYVKAGFRFNPFKTHVDLGKFMPFKSMRNVPIAVYTGVNLDIGSVFDPEFGDVNKFDNTLLLGYGPSVQFLIYERFLFGVEYNFNLLNEGGVHLQSGLNF